MAGVLVSPGFDDAVRKRSSCYKKRGGSPSFKEILRKRCKERFKAKRCALLNQFRQLEATEDVKQIISSLVREEASLLSARDPSLNISLSEEAMDVGIEPLDQLPSTDLEAWWLEEYDRLVEEQLELDMGLLNQHICPLCLSSPLVDMDSTHSLCEACRVPLPPLDRLVPVLDSAYQAHSETQCNALPSCSPVDRSLYLVCIECSHILFITELNH